MHASRSLEHSIPYLTDQVDPELRELLRQTLACLHQPLVSLQSFQKPLLCFATLVFDSIGEERPNDNPCSCLGRVVIGM